MSKIKFILDRKWTMFVVLLVFLGFVYFQNSGSENEKLEEVISSPTKQVDVITFGEWDPDENREVLATIESDQEVDILAEVSGTIDKVLVDIGDDVVEGHVLARYKKSSDPTQINYENALRNLSTTKLSAENLIKQSEINLDSAISEYKQIRLSEEQNKRKAFERLKTQSKNSEILITNYLNWIDRLFGVSNTYRYESVSDREGIGAQDKVGKQNVKNETEKLVYSKSSLLKDLLPDAGDGEIFQYAENRLVFLSDTKSLAVLFDDLLHRTKVTSSFSQTQLDSLKSQSSVFLDKLNAEILNLESTIELTKTEQRRINLSLVSAENRIENTEANVELSKSNAQAQISGAQNQYYLAQSSQNDLEIRAPFHGKIVKKFISSQQQVSSGKPIFSLLNQAASLKVVAYLESEELQKVQEKGISKILLEDGREIESSHEISSIRIDPMTQKVRVEFYIDKQDRLLVGQLVKVLLPVNGTKDNLLPLSAFSFEPTGTEVLVVNQDGVVERRKTRIGETVSNTVEVLEGLESGDKIVQHRNRVFSGERVSYDQ